MSCPSVALGLFIGLILYDHRRAIACSKLISSKRQWVKGEREKKKSPFRWLLVARDGDQQMMNATRRPNTCLTATAFAH